MRNTEEAIKEDLLIMFKKRGEDDSYHWWFDYIIEDRLMELDPKYMKALSKEYEDSNMARRCS